MHKITLTCFLSFISILSFSQTEAIFCKQVSGLQTLIKNEHYKPKQVNDSLSKGVFYLFLERLDYNKDFFIESDIQKLKTDEYKLDDYIVDNNCDFISKYITLLEDRIHITESILENLKKTPIDYSGKLDLQFIPNSQYTYYKDEEAFKIGLQKRVGFKTLSKLIDENEDLEYLKSNFKALEVEAKSKIIKNELCLLNEILNKNGGIKKFTEESFLNALVQYNDPNSTFFNDSEKIEFENELSKNQLSFGIITSKNNNGDIIISGIIPGSPAFKNGLLEEDDILKMLKADSSVLETLCVSNGDIQAFTNAEANKIITFTVKKKNGTLQDITLTKSKIKVDDNAIRGYLLGESLNIGYIKIPSFYTDEESPNGRGLTSDIAKELYKLQKEKIQGLIIDLRYNGGGSMQEAIELSGMFIDRGPLSIIKTNTDEKITIRDLKRGSFYTKPLIILVNNYSASASEFFACAMQDYNRAIIVGSKTHGKSSAQTIIPISESENLGFCKLTIDAFYRVTGKSHQSIGVIPDITLPSMFENFESGEYYRDFALKNDSIAVINKHKPLPKPNLAAIKLKSEERITKEKDFQNIEKNNSILYSLLFNKGEHYKLTIDDVKKNRTQYETIMDTIFNIEKDSFAIIKIKNTQSTNEILKYNNDDAEQNEITLEELSKDIYIKEAQNILIDFLNSKN